ncbi:hypothetical protein D3C80_937860 [compost metagenome]
MDSFQLECAAVKRWTNKKKDASARRIEFKITVQSMKNLLKAKRCYYTGMLLTDQKPGEPVKPTDRTIDRVDSNKGYIPGNVVACCQVANTVKSVFENPETPLDIADAIKLFKRTEQHCKKKLKK